MPGKHYIVSPAGGGPPIITTNSPLPSGEVGLFYDVQLQGTSGNPPYSNWQVVSGSLPGGLSLSTGGQISGTPTTATSLVPVIQMQDSKGELTAPKSLSFTIVPAVKITTASPLPAATTGMLYSQALAAANGVPGYTWSLIAQAGTNTWTVTPSGMVSGTPTTAETDSLEIMVQDAIGGQAIQIFSLPVNATPSVNPIGTNISAGGTSSYVYEGFPLTKNRVRQGGQFTVAFASGAVALDANGWPAADWQQTLYSGVTNSAITWWQGTFQCGYTSRGNGPTQAGGSEVISGTSATVSNVTYNSGTKQVLFQLTPTQQQFGYEVTGTTSGGGSGGAPSVFAYLPAYNSNVTIDNPLLSAAWTNEAISFYNANFAFIRWMWHSNVLYNTGKMTATNRNIGGPTGTCQTRGAWVGTGSGGTGTINEGYPFDWAFGFCLAAGIGCWYNLPVDEDGPNANAGSYTNALLNSAGLASLLAAGQNAYLEIGNELVWNGAYPIGAQLQALGVAAGFANSGTGAFQYLGQKLHALANAIRTSSVASYLNTQIFIVFANQTSGNGWDNFIPTVLNYMTTTYGAGTVAADLGWLSTAPYMNLANVLSPPFTAFFSGSVSGTTLTTSTSQTGIAVGNVLLGTPLTGSIPNMVQVTGGSGTSYTLSQSFTAGIGPMATVSAQPTIAQVEANLTAAGVAQAYSSAIEHCSLTAIHFGMKGYIPYEGGWQVNSEVGVGHTTGNITSLAAVQADAGLTPAMEALWSGVLDAGALGIAQFVDGVNQTAPGTTNYSPIDNLSAAYPGILTSGSPKLAALQSYVSGAYTRKRNIITTPGSLITAAASADSLLTGNAQPFNTFGNTPYSGGTNYSQWWQFYSATARSVTMQIGVVSGTDTPTVEWNGLVLGSVALAPGTVNVTINIRAGFNGLLMVSPAFNTITLSGFTF